MNSINGSTTRIYSTSVDKASSKVITPARAFSFINAHSSAQKPQTSPENKASSSIKNKNTVNNSDCVAPPYFRLQYRQGLAQYKTSHVVANESLFRNWLALVDNNDKWFNAEKTEVGTKLITHRTFKQALSKSMQKIFSQSHVQLNEKECETLSNVIQRHYLLKGNFDFHSIFMDIRDNRQQLLEQLTQSFVKTLTKNAADLTVEMQGASRQNGIKEQAATQAKNLITCFRSVLDEHHDSGNLEKIQQQMEAEFLKAFNYEVVNEKDLQAGKCKKDEFFVANEDGSYSMVTLDNFFKPLYEPVDPDIYQRDKIENPDRDNLSAYFKTHIGKQILAYSGHEDDWEISKEEDFAEKTWEQAKENEKNTEKNPKTKARINLDEVKRRDGLFSQKDAFESGASLLLSPLELFNAAGEYWGFTTRPHTPRKNQFTDSKEWIPSEPHAINKPSSTDPLIFPVAEAASILSTEKTLMEKQTQEEYGSWYEEGIAKTESLNRQKRAFKEGKITLDQIVKVSFEQNLGISADPVFENLRTILNRDLSYYLTTHDNPDAERFKEIKTTVAEILKNHQHSRKMLKFLSNTLGALQMAAMENNEDFRRAYMLYMHENEKSILAKGTFFYHADVEKLFPPSYQAHDQGTVYFQQIPENRNDILNNRINIYALLLHQQTLGLPLNYRSLAMAFAHIDILNYAFKGRAFIHTNTKLYDSWTDIAQNTRAIIKKFPAIQKYFLDRGLSYPINLMTPFATGQHLHLSRFITSNTLSIKGVCHYLTMTVMLALADRNLDEVANVKEMLSDFNKLSASDPIIYFRIAHLLANANRELFAAFGPLPGSPVPVLAQTLFKKFKYNNRLADMIFNNHKHGFNIIVGYGDNSHSIGVMPIEVGNEIIHYYFDPNNGIIPCFCKEQLEEAIKTTFEGVGVKNVNDPNEIKNVEIHAVKLISRNLSFFKQLQTNSGFKFNQLDKQTLSRFANSHALSNEDWSAFFPNFNKGEKLYNKDFDSLEGDLIYKALKTDTPLITLSHLYSHALTNLPSNPINLGALSSATIGDVLERERLSATTNQGTYHNAAQALESETWSTLGTLGDSESRLSLLFSSSSSSSSSSSNAQDTISDRTRFSVSLDDLLTLPDPSELAGFVAGARDHRSTQSLGQDILDSVVDGGQNQASSVTSRRTGIRGLASRVRNVFIGCFQRLDRDRDALEAEFYELTNLRLNPPTVASFLDEISQENISEADLDAIDLETHKINQQVNLVNTEVAEILKTQGLQANDFRFSSVENIGATDAILLHQINNPAEKFNIDLSKHPKLANLWQEVKTVINGRTRNFAATMTSHLSGAQRASILGNGWKAVGHVSDAGSKFLSLYALTTLGDETRFFQQSHLGAGEKVLNILTMADLVLDNGANAAGFANSVVKRFFTPSSTLSKISRFTGKTSNTVSLIVQGFELGFYAYAYSNAQTSMEREVAKLMLVSKSFQSALSIASITACAAAPPLAPIFMMLSLFISYVENAALTKTLSKETADMLFRQFAGELEFMRTLLEKPELLFNEEEDQITVVSADMPYSKLVVTADGIQMIRDAEPFAVEFTETFRQTVEQYKGIVFREPGTHAGGLPVYDYDNMPAEYQDYKEMLQSFGRGFKQGFSLSPKNDDIGEFTGYHKKSREYFINQESTDKNGTFTEEIAQRQVVVGNIVQCLTKEAEKATPTYQHAFTKSNKAQNIVIQGHPVKPIYQSTGCTQGQTRSYSYAPRWNEINKLDQCDTAPDSSTKPGKFWKTRRVKDIYRYTEESTAPKLYKGKLAFKESSNMPHLKPDSAININQWNLETSWKAHTCYESPDNVRVEVGSPQYVLGSGGASPYVYHFPQDEFVENVKRLYTGEEDELEAQVSGHQVYGLYSGFPISGSNVDEKSSWFDIVLVPDGNAFLQLYPNTYLNISEQAATETTPSKGDIHLMIPYKTLRLNGIGLGQKAIISKKAATSPKASDKKELVFLPETNQPIHIKLDDSVKRTVNVDIIKELPNKSTAACGVLVSQDEKGSLSLELNQISQVPLGNIASTTTFISNQIKELKGVVPDLAAKAVRVHSLDISKTPYHQEKALEIYSPPLAPIWEKTLKQISTAAPNPTSTAALNQTSTAALNQTSTVALNQTSTAALNQTSTAALNQTSTVALNQTSTAALNQTSTAALNQTSTAALNQTSTAALNQTSTAALNQTSTAAPNQTSTAALNQTSTAAINQTLKNASSKNKTEFFSTAWYFARDENIKDHPTTQKHAGLMVPKIWRSDLPSEVQEIIQRMVFVGFAHESMIAVPEDVKSAITHQDECFSYHFFDPQTELLIKQWGASEIRFWDSQDITQCSPNRIPQKIFWSGSETENYTCDVVHISPPTETMGGAQGRAAIMVEADSSKLEFTKANLVTNKKFLNYIFDKSLSALMQRAKADPYWDPDESDLDLQNLMIHVKDIKLKYKDQSTAPVQAFLLHDKEPKLALVPKGEGLLAIPKMQNYAITAARVETLETDTKPIYKLFKRSLIEGEAYEKINEQLTSGALAIDEVDLAEKSEIKPEFQFIGIKNSPLDNAIICHTSEGIAMALDYGLENTKLLGISNDYLTNKGISLNEEMAILSEYQSLVNRIGSSAFAYLNLYQSDEKNPEQSSIFVNTQTAVPTLVYVPVFYYETAQDNRTVKKAALSKELLILSDTNDITGQTKRAVVQDVATKKIYTVWRSDNTHPNLGDVFPYTYVAPSANSVFLGLDQHAYTPSQDVELPKINIDRLSLLPCDKQEQKRVVLRDWMLTRLSTLTLAKPIRTNEYAQQILLTPSLLTEVKSIKSVITKDTLGALQLSLFMSTQNQDATEGSELIRINLENAISTNGQLDPTFIDSVKLHDTILDLQQLTNEAYAEYLKNIV